MFTANNQVILEETYDENFQPTEEEIIEYAEFIGLDPDNVGFNQIIFDSSKTNNLTLLFH